VYSYRINYHANGSPATVTATVLPAVPVGYSEVPPTVSGTAVAGQMLSESHGIWANKPTSYDYQWEDCDSAGSNCANISGATGQTYVLTGTDVGHTIRVQETASNAEGSGTPTVSAPTVVVQAAPPSSGQNKGGSTGGSQGGGAGSISVEQIKASLAQQLVPSGKAAKIATLLKSGGLTMSFKALEAGTLSVQWYEIPAGAKLAKKVKAKPVLVASGQATFSAAGTGKLRIKLTAVGKRLLKHAKSLKLTAKGVFTPTGGPPVSAVMTLAVSVHR
jgi:hypothetical protein